MIFTMDVGNTNIKMGLFNGKELIRYWRMSTSSTSTSDEYGTLVTSLFT
ncbi:MAG: type III pantothenate kinase, partial [Clostridia bacterium]|nr:type III pantothenate kinase [Clostridia bacterium]